MAAYLIVDTELFNPELYESYKLRAKPIAEKFGGEYLARGGAMSIKEDKLWSPKRMVLVKFASKAQAEDFYNDSEYQEVLKISEKSANRTVVIIESI